MSGHRSRYDGFEQALRTGPKRMEPSLGFAQRMENGWRHAPVESASDGLAWWRRLLVDLTAPAVALAALALVVVLFYAAPQVQPQRAPHVASSSAHFNPKAVLPRDSLASLRSSMEGAYAEESRLMMEDTARALRFAASQVLPPEMLARAEDHGWFAGTPSREG